ncbi:MAG: LysR substrate-binding domain-containing protein [Thiolinea sp.]
MAKDISLRQLRYFVAAAETGQLSLAAKRVHVAQSTVTSSILLLEESLGLELFQRQPHGVILTAEGYKFYHRAKQILDMLDEAVNEPRFQSHELTGSIRVAATYALLGYYLPSRMARFRQQYPDINIDLHDLERAEIEARVLNGDLELGVVLLSNVSERERFGHHVLLRSRRQLWASTRHPLLEQKHAALEDIAAYPYIQITVDEAEAATRRYWQARGLKPNIAFRTSAMEGLRGLVAHGFGVTILADMVYRPWSLEGTRIEAVPVLDVIPHLEVGLIWNRERELARPAAAFQQF